jgi:hypothetical protein
MDNWTFVLNLPVSRKYLDLFEQVRLGCICTSWRNKHWPLLLNSVILDGHHHAQDARALSRANTWMRRCIRLGPHTIQKLILLLPQDDNRWSKDYLLKDIAACCPHLQTLVLRSGRSNVIDRGWRETGAFLSTQGLESVTYRRDESVTGDLQTMLSSLPDLTELVLRGACFRIGPKELVSALDQGLQKASPRLTRLRLSMEFGVMCPIHNTTRVQDSYKTCCSIYNADSCALGRIIHLPALRQLTDLNVRLHVLNRPRWQMILESLPSLVCLCISLGGKQYEGDPRFYFPQLEWNDDICELLGASGARLEVFQLRGQREIKRIKESTVSLTGLQHLGKMRQLKQLVIPGWDIGAPWENNPAWYREAGTLVSQWPSMEYLDLSWLACSHEWTDGLSRNCPQLKIVEWRAPVLALSHLDSVELLEKCQALTRLPLGLALPVQSLSRLVQDRMMDTQRVDLTLTGPGTDDSVLSPWLADLARGQTLHSLTITDQRFRRVPPYVDDRSVVDDSLDFIWTPDVLSMLAISYRLQDVDLEGSYVIGTLSSAAVCDALGHAPLLTMVRLWWTPVGMKKGESNGASTWQQDLTGSLLAKFCTSNVVGKNVRNPGTRQPLLNISFASNKYEDTLRCVSSPNADTAQRILDILAVCRHHTLEFEMAISWNVACDLLDWNQHVKREDCDMEDYRKKQAEHKDIKDYEPKVSPARLWGIRHVSRAQVAVIFHMCKAGVDMFVTYDIPRAQTLYHMQQSVNKTLMFDQPPKSADLLEANRSLVYVRFC